MVTGLQGVTLGAGHFPRGCTVYEPWLEGNVGNMERLGLVSHVGDVEEVPDLVELAALIAGTAGTPAAEPVAAELDPEVLVAAQAAVDAGEYPSIDEATEAWRLVVEILDGIA